LNLLYLSKELNSLFGEIIFSQFLFISTLLCVLGFQVVMVDGVAGKMVPAVYGVTMLIQLLVYALGGQAIVDKSEAVANDFYEVDRDFLIITARPMKPSITKSIFFTADLPTFVTIINATGSLITMLKSFVK
jgi:hypothetical protein